MRIVFEIVADGVKYRKSDVANAVRSGYFVIGAAWQSKFRKRHFTTFAFQEYGYTPRNKKYDRAKLKHTGRMLPLVFSGDSRDLSERADIRATRNGVDVVSQVKAFNYKNRFMKVDMRKEFTTVTVREQRELDAAAVKEVHRQLRTLGRPSKVKVG